MVSNTADELEELLNFPFDSPCNSSSNFIKEKVLETEVVFGISVAMVIPDKSKTRGASIVSLGVLSSNKYFASYRNLLLNALDLVVNGPDPCRVLKALYSSLNKANWKSIPHLSPQKARIEKWLHSKFQKDE